jgi:hypothetical protein
MKKSQGRVESSNTHMTKAEHLTASLRFWVILSIRLYLYQLRNASISTISLTASVVRTNGESS